MDQAVVIIVLMFTSFPVEGTLKTVIADKQTADEDVLIMEGESVRLSCQTDMQWFFCLWNSPQLGTDNRKNNLSLISNRKSVWYLELRFLIYYPVLTQNKAVPSSTGSPPVCAPPLTGAILLGPNSPVISNFRSVLSQTASPVLVKFWSLQSIITV